MVEPLAYFRGEFLPTSQLVLPVYDAGFVQGVAVSEQLRTFGGRLFRLEQHLARLGRSLEIVGQRGAISIGEVTSIAERLVAHNHPLLEEGDDLGLSLFVTPGPYATLAPPDSAGPTVGLHTYPLPFSMWEKKYQLGQRLIVSDVRQVPTECWPAELKCRSRMHYYLADRQAESVETGARALLLDLDEYVVEASTANIVFFDCHRGLVSPPKETILPGVSVAMLQELAASLSIPFVYAKLRVPDLLRADEVLLCSTSPCVWPVISINRQPVSDGRPGSIFERLITAWSERVGVDIRDQARRFRQR
jgi:branched-subunit amino acid aminotransferase/4-amino-4-deoxychorismate lyase